MSSVLWIAVRTGIFFFLTVSLGALSLAALNTFLQWGAEPSGGAFTGASFLSPSTIVDMGARAAWPIQQMLLNYDGWSVLLNLKIVIPYMIAYWVILLAFALVALHMMITIIEFHLAVMVAAVLFPWGLLSHTAFLCEFVVSWVTAGLIRVLLTVAIMAISIPLFEGLQFTVTGGGDPTLYSAVIYAATAIIFAILAWVLPARAAAVGGRGHGVGLDGRDLAAHQWCAGDCRRRQRPGDSGGACDPGRVSDDSGPEGGITWRGRSLRPQSSCGSYGGWDASWWSWCCITGSFTSPFISRGSRMDETLPVMTNGHEAPDTAEMQAIQAAYAEVSRRDTSLEHRLYHSHVREIALTA